MRFRAIWLAVIAMLLAAPCYALDPRDLEDCDQSADWDRKIAGCTKLLSAGWTVKEDFARALADLDIAIGLNPKNPATFSARGVATVARIRQVDAGPQ